MRTHARAVVIGGGVVGVSTLYHLARKGWTDSVLIERKELTSGSTWHAAGLLPLFNLSYSVGQIHRYSVGLYQTLEKETGPGGAEVDFRLSAQRDVAAVKAFFRKAIKGQHDAPRTIPLDGYAASHRAVRELKTNGLLPAKTKLRSSRSLNNLIEQDHRGVKQRIATMLGFKGFATAAITIAGIELMHPIRKGQFGLGRLGVQGRLAPAVWNAVLQA
jgi:DDE superfamily endonuclease/FAD dependent oxidoreductase